MDQEVIKPDRNPRGSSQSLGLLGCFLAAAGATLLAFCLVGAAATASVWAFSKMIGLPDIIIEILMVAVAIPVVMTTVWTAGRAWHVEQRLEQGLDIDSPVFSTFYYWRKRA